MRILLVFQDLWKNLSINIIFSGAKSSGKNIEVALCAVSDKGQVFNVSI